MNQKGLSSLILLCFIVLGVFIIWELNESFNPNQTNRSQTSANPEPGSSEPICLTGEANNCNDSNDNFILE